MSIPSGTRLGRYEVRARIGEGGMGEVYRATDPRLGRDVAIKVLPAAFSEDAERLRRFEQEAQAAGALNHPNILAIYDVSTHDGAPYVVSELLEGETLREALGGSRLPPRRAVEYALQLASGLAAAHDKGIVHRDLKPENVFITREGRLKILDFGLAKLVDPTIDSATLTSGPTREVQTNPGSVMGTVGYMSPEQVRGQPVDHRTDIFSFGAVLYEMLSGRRAFGGDSAADAVSAVLKEEPPEFSATDQPIPPGLERVVRRCMEKNRERRFQSASDLAFALEALSGVAGSGATTISAGPTIEAPRPPRRVTRVDRLGWLAAGLLLGLSVVFAALYFRSSEPPAEAMRFALPSQEGTEHESFALAPDGRSIAMVMAGAAGQTLLWLQTLDSTTPRRLEGTEGATSPFWSPDSRFIGFFAGNRLKKIDVSGGLPQEITQSGGDSRGGAWAADGTILFAPGFTAPLYKVSSAGGAKPVPATVLDQSQQQTSHRWPSFLPDGRRFLFFSRATRKEAEGIYVGSLDSDERQLVLSSTHLAHFAPRSPGEMTGHLLFMRGDTLVAQVFDADSLRFSGEPFAIHDGVLNFPGENGPTGYAAFSISATGRLAYLVGRELSTQLGWYDRNGNLLGTVSSPGSYHEPSLSPDGKRVAFERSGDGPGSDIWVLDMGRTTMTKLTFDATADACPLWSPDGSRIIFSSLRSGRHHLYQKLWTGAGNDELLLKTETNAFANDWTVSPNGSAYLLFELEGADSRFDLYILPLFGDRKPFPFLNTPFNETHAQFSPDGRWIAYSSDESGRSEVYVQSFPPSGGKWPVSTNGGDQAQWRADGRELYYIAPDKKLVAVSVSVRGDSFDAGVPVTLFTTRVPTTSLTDHRNNYVPGGDGQRFLFNNELESRKAEPITLVLNWTGQTRR